MVAFQETIYGRERDFIVELLEDLELLSQDLLLRVSVVCDVYEILNFRHVDFFILGRDEHGGDAKELILAAWDFLRRTVSVNQVHSDEECLRLELILQVNFNEP